MAATRLEAAGIGHVAALGCPRDHLVPPPELYGFDCCSAENARRRRLHARFGKSRRTEPIVAFFETGEAKLADRFPELEDQLAGLTVGGDHQGKSRSPDRADAMMRAMTELL
jgi:hypothetical protein